MDKNFVVKEFSQSTWADFDALFGKHKGVRGGCWCTFNLCTSSQFDKMSREQRRAFQQSLVEQGLGSGILVYDGQVPIGWCQVGPAARFPRFERNRIYKELTIPEELKPDWRISCLFVDKHRRNKGLSRVVLDAAITYIRENGGGVVEAFPMDVPGAKYPQYTGSTQMYLEQGFETITQIGKNTWLMRLII